MKLDTIPSVSVTNKNTETLEYRLTARNNIALLETWNRASKNTRHWKNTLKTEYYKNNVLFIMKYCYAMQDIKPIL